MLPYLLLFASLENAAALICLQCNGWQGDYPMKSSTLNQCNNLNNQCQTDFYCVKITDPMKPGVPYAIYKSQCWNQDSLSVTPMNTTNIESGRCYDFEGAGIPPVRYKYCFCSNEDYCNEVSVLPIMASIIIPVVSLLLI
ncbi:hypothetical protein V3C99_011393 [Haemonchus contortus]